MALLVARDECKIVSGAALRRLGGRVVLLAIALWTSALTAAETAPTQEYQIKAVFLFNFARFVDWPPTVFAGPEAPLVIGILGDDPFGTFLDDTIRGERVGGRSLVVRRYRRVEEMGVCHILFISRSESTRLAEIMRALKGRSVLTVGEAEEFNQRSGMIRFVTENKKVRLRINVEAAHAADLAISAKLLRPAEIVTAGKG